jgi:hypothetical protein
MQIVRMRGGREFMLTDKEAFFAIKKISEKDVAVMPRLGNLVVSDFDKEYLGPLDDDESLRYPLFSDINGILYCFDGKDWLYYHYTGNPFKKSFGVKVVDADDSAKKEINVDWEKEKDLKNRKWTKVPETHEVAVIPIEKYLEIKFTPQLKLLSQPDASRRLPAIVGAEVTMIGMDKRLAREEESIEHQKYHDKKIEWFSKLSLKEKQEAVDETKNFEGNKDKERADFYTEFYRIFLRIMLNEQTKIQEAEKELEKELELSPDAQDYSRQENI